MALCVFRSKEVTEGSGETEHSSRQSTRAQRAWKDVGDSGWHHMDDPGQQDVRDTVTGHCSARCPGCVELWLLRWGLLQLYLCS